MATKRAPRPAFARTFPSDAELDALVAAFGRGDFATVRKEAPGLASRTNDEGVKRAALELRRRIDPDPIGLILIFMAMGLLAVIAGYYWTHKA